MCTPMPPSPAGSLPNPEIPAGRLSGSAERGQRIGNGSVRRSLLESHQLGRRPVSPQLLPTLEQARRTAWNAGGGELNWTQRREYSAAL